MNSNAGDTPNVYTVEEVAKHNKADDCWIIIENKVYDVTDFLQDHPGGRKVVLREAGKDATKKFKALHAPSVLSMYDDDLMIGVIGSSNDAVATAVSKRDQARKLIESAGFYGDLIPYGDPNWYAGWNSPYYNDSHRRVRKQIRMHVEQTIMPYVDEWDEKKKIPLDLFKKSAALGYLGAVMGPPWLTEYYGTVTPGNVKPEDFDYFHELIIIDETSRTGSGGVMWGLLGGHTIGLPPIIHFGSKWLKDKVVKEIMRGDATICLAITEPYAGSDVAQIRCTAKRATINGEEVYVVNGEKNGLQMVHLLIILL